MILSIGSLFGFFAVAFGAYAEHGLKKHLTPEAFSSIETALRYQMLHALVMVAIGLFLAQNSGVAKASSLQWCGFGFAAGILCFSFSIYINALFGVPAILKLAPIGGILLMVSWLRLAWLGANL